MEQEIKETIVKKIDKKDIDELYRDGDIKEAAIIIKRWAGGVSYRNGLRTGCKCSDA